MIKAILRDKLNSKGQTLIYVRYTYKGKRAHFSTNETVDPKYFDGYVKKGFDGYTRINARIDQVKKQVDDTLKKLILQDIPLTTENLKFNFLFNAKDKFDFFSEYRKWIASEASRKSNRTIINYNTSLTKLEEFQQKTKSIFSLEKINLSFYNKYLKFLYEGGAYDNTAGGYIKWLLTFLHALEDQGYTISKDVTKFKILREPPNIIYLTQEELEKFRIANLKGRHERVRDLFVFQCFTSLRISDLERFGVEHIKGGDIDMTAYKNFNNVHVPLMPATQEILEKYDYKLPIISGQRYNDYLKEALEIAGLDRMVELSRKRGGEKVFKKLPLYKAVSNHAAVRTFITHRLEDGFTVIQVARMSGKSVDVINKHYYGFTRSDMKTMWEEKYGKVKMRIA